MALGFFVVAPPSGDPRGIAFNQRPDREGAVPEDQSEVVFETSRILTVLQLLFPKEGDKRFKEYYDSLISFARFGVVSDNAQPAFANKLLASFKSEILSREAGRVKNRYMRQLGAWALLSGGIAFLAAAWLTLRWQTPIAASFLVVVGGSQLGVWLSFGIRKVEYAFDDLTLPEADRLDPIIRLLFTAGLSFILSLAFYTKLVVVSLGGFSPNEFPGSLTSALLLGLLLGVSELALGTRVARHATQLVEGASKT